MTKNIIKLMMKLDLRNHELNEQLLELCCKQNVFITVYGFIIKESTNK
jgi:hypothetical protein